jgi:hypothetical protein
MQANNLDKLITELQEQQQTLGELAKETYTNS